MESTFKKILVCLDASQQALHVAEYLSRFIPPANFSARLFSIFHRMPHTFWDAEPVSRDAAGAMKTGIWAQKQKESIAHLLDMAADKFRKAGMPPDRCVTDFREREHGVARDIIIESNKGYDVVVVGRTAKRELREWLIGSVTSKLLDHLGHVSLCIVGGNPDPGKILVALDRSDCSKNSLDFICSLTAGGGKELLLFNAVRHLNLPAYIAESPGVKEADHGLMEETRQIIQHILEENRSRMIQAGIPGDRIQTKIAFGVQSRSAAIVKEARSAGCGTIVLGRRGLSNMEEFFMGRVSSAVVHLADKEAVWVVC